MYGPITFEALHILDAIDRRGSFAAAATELYRAPSSLSYQIQKLEQDLDIMIFDRSGHKANFTDAGRLILERGRAILAATDKLVSDATLLANGWELDITIAYECVIPVATFFPLVKALSELSKTQVRLQEETLVGSWEALATGRADILICPRNESPPTDVRIEPLGVMDLVWVASPMHHVHHRENTETFDEAVRKKYRVVAIADSAREQSPISINVLHKQPRLTVTNFDAKCQALTDGLGIGTLPREIANRYIEMDQLKLIDGAENSEGVEIVMAWRRNTIGEAKSWCIQYLKNHWT